MPALSSTIGAVPTPDILSGFLLWGAAGGTTTATATTGIAVPTRTVALTGTTSSGFLGTVVVQVNGATISGVAGTLAIGFLGVNPVNVQTVCAGFRVELLNGRHALGSSVIRATTTVDTFKVALYYTTATRGASDTVYTTTGEVTGTNYVAGGIVVANTVVPTTNGTYAYWTPSSATVFTNITIATPFDCMVLYNSTSTTKLEVAVFVFGAQTITAGNFTFQWAANDAVTGLLRLT